MISRTTLMNHDDINFSHLAESWIADWEIRRPDNNRSEPSPSIDIVSNFHLEGEHEALWKFVIETYRKPMSQRVFAILAAGPLEDLLVYFGSEYIDRVEMLARKDSKFNELLGGVWKNAIMDEVWERITRTRKRVW